MASIITIAGEKLFAAKAQANEQLDIDTFIFANVPGQDATAPISREEGLPSDYIVHQQIVQQVGRINDNVVVYSTVLDSVTGPFEFNWVGLYSSVNNTLVAINHIPTTPKTVTAEGVAGNTLNRNFGIEYSGIADLTGIDVAPETWQLDFTARLQGMDKLTQQLTKDMVGKDSFIDDGFKVIPRSTTNTFEMIPGAGYVNGFRVERDTVWYINMTPDQYPIYVYADAYFEGDASSTWAPRVITYLSTDPDKQDFVDGSGVQHYIAPLAIIKGDDDVEDLRIGFGTVSNIKQEYVFKNVKEYLNSDALLPINKIVNIAGYHEGTTTGGGKFIVDYGVHDGGLFIDPKMPFPNDYSNEEQINAWLIEGATEVLGLRRIYDGDVKAEWYGVNTDLGYNDLSNFIALSNARSIDLTKNKYKISKAISLGKIPSIKGNGSEIMAYGSANIGTTSDTRWVSSSNIIENQNAGDRRITVSNIENFAVNDFFFVQNITNYSFGGARSYYKDGDLCQVKSITGSVIELVNPLSVDIVANNYAIHQLNQHEIFWSNISFLADGSSTATLVNLDGVSVKFDNVKLVAKGGNHAIAKSAIYKSTFNDCVFHNHNASVSGFGYGSGLRGGKFITYNSCSFYARRHGSAMGGGGDGLDKIPCRVIRFNDCVFDSFGDVANTHAADGHGNSIDVVYKNCITHAGVVMGGADCYWIGGEIHSNTSQGGMYLREVVKGNISFKPDKYIHNADGASVVSSHSSDEMASAKGDTTITVNCTVEGDVNSSFAVVLYWHTYNHVGLSLNVEKMIFGGNQPNVAFLYAERTYTGAFLKDISILECNYSASVPWFSESVLNSSNNETTVSLPTKTIKGTISIPSTGVATKTVSVSPRYPIKNVTTNISFDGASESEIIVGGRNSFDVDNYYFKLSATEVTGGLIEPKVVTYSIDYIVKNERLLG